MRRRLSISCLLGLTLVVCMISNVFGWCERPYVYFKIIGGRYNDADERHYIGYGNEITIDAERGPGFRSYDPDCTNCMECEEGITCSGDDLIYGIQKFVWSFGDGTVEDENCPSQSDGEFDGETPKPCENSDTCGEPEGSHPPKGWEQPDLLTEDEVKRTLEGNPI